MTTKFEYLLNAMENAAAQDRPADHDYYGKRQAVLKYVADLEDSSSPQITAPRRCDECKEWLDHFPHAEWCSKGQPESSKQGK